MKRYLLTSPKFSGQAELIYNDAGVLMHVALADVVMDAKTAEAFLRCVSGAADNVATKFSAATSIIESEVEVNFDMFWKAYGKKINKSRCMLLWNKMNKTMQAEAYVAIRKYNKYLHDNNWRSKADPETYLRNQYWENEY